MSTNERPSELIEFKDGQYTNQTRAEQITECIGRQMGAVDKRFGDVVGQKEIRTNVVAALVDYFNGTFRDQVGLDVWAVEAVRVSLNNYLESLGIGLMSSEVAPLDRSPNRAYAAGQGFTGGIQDWDDISKIEDGMSERKPPTIGVIPRRFPEDSDLARVVGFKVDDGGEEITVLSDQLAARSYAPGENLDPRGGLWKKNDRVLIPQGSTIGLSVDYVDERKLKDSGLPQLPRYAVESSDGVIKRTQGGVYFCRYLSREAAMKALGFSR